jgi:hypothetical protein
MFRQLTDGPTDLAEYVFVMVELVIDLLIALPLLLLWLSAVSVLVRPFGIQLPATPFSWAKRRSAFQTLTFPRYVIVGGVLYFGCSMLIMSTLSRYLEWRYWHGSALTSENLVREVLSSLLAGVLFGLISWLSVGGNRAK